MILFKERFYKLEKVSKLVPSETHPLQRSFHTVIKSKSTGKSNLKSVSSTKESFLDPLDPLSSKSYFVVEEDTSAKSTLNLCIEPWSSKRLTILTTYTTSEKLSIISSFLSAKPNEQIRIISKTSGLSNKNKSQIEQLDQFEEEVRETSNLSVQQFTEKINELNHSLNASWTEGQRVKSLQIVIQTTKMLSDANVAQFFPSKFVLVTDLVDNFAQMVYDRLKIKSAYVQRGSKVPISLPDNFKENQVPEVAKETAKNWFYKVASIRELVARLYVEAALLPCYRFFDADMIGPSLMRLIKMARGIGDPLLATYARAYVARVGILVEPNRKDYLHLAFDDILNSLKSRRTSSEFSNSSDSQMPYLHLFVPAVDWLLQCLCGGASHSQLDEIMGKIESTNNPLLVHAALNSLDTNYIKLRPIYFANMIQTLTDTAYPYYTMYRQLGACVSINASSWSSSTKASGDAMQLLRAVWKFIGNLTELRHFLDCANAWTEFVAFNFDFAQLTRFMNQIVKEVHRDHEYRTYYSHLLSILNKIISSRCDFQNLLSSSEFIQFLSLFDKEPTIIEARQMVLETFLNSQYAQNINNPIILQACIRILREMHDSLNSLSVEDNRRSVTILVLQLLDRIRFEDKQVEPELELLTQFRSSFGTIELVIWALVERTNALAMRVRSLRPGLEHNASSASFVRACMAFNYITIASVENMSLAIKLYTSAAQVAVVNGCLGQSEASIKEAIHLLSKLDISSTNNINSGLVADMAANICSTLLMCVDICCVIGGSNSTMSQEDRLSGSSDSSTTLYLLKGLINAIHMCPALKTDQTPGPTTRTVIKGELYIKVLMLLAAYAQSEYLYRGGRTDANDKIYGGSETLMSTISELFHLMVTRIRSYNHSKLNSLLHEVLKKLLNYSYVAAESDDKPDWLKEILEDQSIAITTVH